MNKALLLSLALIGSSRLYSLQGDKKSSYSEFSSQYVKLFGEKPSERLYNQDAPADCASHGGDGSGCEGGSCSGGTEA